MRRSGVCSKDAWRSSGALEWLLVWECAAGRCALGLAVWRSVLCTDFPVLLALGMRGETRYALVERFAQTIAASQLLKRASRAIPKAALLGAIQRTPAHSALPLVALQQTFQRYGACASGCLCDAEKRRGAASARSAHRPHACGACLNAALEERVVSCAAWPCHEHRREPRAAGQAPAARSASPVPLPPRHVVPDAIPRRMGGLCTHGKIATNS